MTADTTYRWTTSIVSRGTTAEETALDPRQAVELIAAIVRHRQPGADLPHEPYNVDVGGPG